MNAWARGFVLAEGMSLCALCPCMRQCVSSVCDGDGKEKLDACTRTLACGPSGGQEHMLRLALARKSNERPSDGASRVIQPWPFLTPKAWRAKNVAGEKGGSESLPDRGVIAHALESHGDGLAKGKKNKGKKKTRWTGVL
ncbi:hypothetical protein H0G86_007964 [Trichoderma simmonsii]|uniref:Secreted protein n=1 Tax=Trichoderma simmonsii TaxID=1491479 RepID=A0A8G0LJP6_9HYPO|nr:hypothetical protein H0G86_007964 [Trichoderma simmonsii]